jgi:C4-dicarboxylate transporter/malic acid transport protein
MIAAMSALDSRQPDVFRTPLTPAQQLREHGAHAAPRRPRSVLAAIGPNWFTAVMGTGIVANAGALLPVRIPEVHAVALLVWVLAAALLLALLLLTALQWARHGERARSHHRDSAMAQFYGAPPMAMLTVGAGALLLGGEIVGKHAAVLIDGTLWVAGTGTGLASAAAIPYLMFTRHRLAQRDTLATWLMPLVPPMVSAAAGAGLVPHLATGQLRLSLLLFCIAEVGLSLIAALINITLLWARLAYEDVGPATTVPTLWIVLGPLGTSITAVGLFAKIAPHAIGAPYAEAIQAAAVLYGVPVWGFAMLWVSLAVAITLRTARAGLPFTLAWWSFTFPVGTIVTGTSELALHTHLLALNALAVIFYDGLVITWAIASKRTLGGLLSGHLLATTPLTPAAPQSHNKRSQ